MAADSLQATQASVTECKRARTIRGVEESEQALGCNLRSAPDGRLAEGLPSRGGRPTDQRTVTPSRSPAVRFSVSRPVAAIVSGGVPAAATCSTTRRPSRPVAPVMTMDMVVPFGGVLGALPLWGGSGA